MARIRTIKPEFWSSPNMAGADPWARLLFIAMWNWADDTGRGTANVKELAAFAFPHDNDPDAPTAAELPSLLAEIRGRFGVVFYEVDGRRFYAIPSWDRHQRNERRAKSRFPAPEEGVEFHPCPSDQRFPDRERKVAELPLQSHGSSDATHGSSGPGTGEQGNRGTGEKESSADAVDETFAAFWSAYPRKDGKANAVKAWKKATKTHDPDSLVSEAQRWAGLWHGEGREKQFIPHAATWLNGERWTDEPPARRLKAVAGDYRPYNNPDDPSIYEGEL